MALMSRSPQLIRPNKALDICAFLRHTCRVKSGGLRRIALRKPVASFSWNVAVTCVTIGWPRQVLIEARLKIGVAPELVPVILCRDANFAHFEPASARL